MGTTVRHALQQLAQYNGSAGTSWEAPSNLRKLNSVRELIYERGEYEGTTTWCLSCLTNGCFYLPEVMETLKAVFFCKSIGNLRNAHWRELGRSEAQVCCWESSAEEAVVQATEIKRPYYSKPLGFFRAGLSCDSAMDAGKVITVTGRHTGSVVTNDITLVEDEIAFSEDSFDDIVSVAKDVTDGQVTLYAKQPDLTAVVMGEYSWWHEAPMFARYKSRSKCGGCGCAVLYGKKKFHALRVGEALDIQSMSALRFGYQALNVQGHESRDDDYVKKLQLMENSLEKTDARIGINEPSEPVVVRYDLTDTVIC